jgi:hypothetical protein
MRPLVVVPLPPAEVYAYVLNGWIHEAGSYALCAKRATDSGIPVEGHVFRYVLQGGVK